MNNKEADQRFCCSPTAEDRFSRVKAHLKLEIGPVHLSLVCKSLAPESINADVSNRARSSSTSIFREIGPVHLSLVCKSLAPESINADVSNRARSSSTSIFRVCEQQRLGESRDSPEFVALQCDKNQNLMCLHNSIGPDKDILSVQNFNYFLTHLFKHVFWVLKRTVSLRRFF